MAHSGKVDSMRAAHALLLSLTVLTLSPAAAQAQREVPLLRPAPSPPSDVPAGGTAQSPAPTNTREAILESLSQERGGAQLPPHRALHQGSARAPRQVPVGNVAMPLVPPAAWPLTVTPQNVTAQQPGQSATAGRDRISLSLAGADYQGPNSIILRQWSTSLFGYQVSNPYAALEVEVRTPGYYVVSATGWTANSEIRLDVFSSQAASTGTPIPNPQTNWNPGQHTLHTWKGQNGTKQFPFLVELEAGTYWFYYIVRSGVLQLQQASLLPLEQG
jgi:hypothetical protein